MGKNIFVVKDDNENRSKKLFLFFVWGYLFKKYFPFKNKESIVDFYKN